MSFGGGRAATALLLECSIGRADPLLARNPSREPPQSRDSLAGLGIDRRRSRRFARARYALGVSGAAGKALVTGGAGFIGSHLCERLLEAGWEVYALDDLSTSRTETLDRLREYPAFHLVVDSVLASSVVNELVHKCDVIYHLAGHASATGGREELFRLNVDATVNLLAAAGRLGTSVRVMLASSGYVYGACSLSARGSWG